MADKSFHLRLPVEKIRACAVFSDKNLRPCNCSGTFFTALTNCESPKSNSKVIKIQLIEM